jgi:hypothetical protein
MGIIDRLGKYTGPLGYAYYGYYLIILNSDNGNKYRFYIANNDGCDVRSTNAATTNEWTHVVGVKSGSDIKLYINGSLDATTTNCPISEVGNGREASNDNDLRIGDKIWGGSLDGAIDHVAIYDRALDAAEVEFLYSSY